MPGVHAGDVISMSIDNGGILDEITGANDHDDNDDPISTLAAFIIGIVLFVVWVEVTAWLCSLGLNPLLAVVIGLVVTMIVLVVLV